MTRRGGPMRGGAALAGGMAGGVVALAVAVLVTLNAAGVSVIPSSVTGPQLRAPTTTVQPVGPERVAQVIAGLPTSTSPAAVVPVGVVFWPDCPTARNAGVTSLRRGDAGYRPGLDRDGDGQACESPPLATTTTPPVRIVVLPATSRPTSASNRPGAPPVRPSPVPQPPTAPTSPPTGSTAPTTLTTVVVATTGPPDTDPPAPPPTEPPTTTTTTAPPPLPVLGDCNQATQAAADGRLTLPLTPTSPYWNPALDVDGDGLACEDDTTPPPTTTSTRLVVDSCVAAWDLSLAPIPTGSPYYRADWDGDSNGVACEVDPRGSLDSASITTSTSTSAAPPPVTTTTAGGDGR